MNTATEYSQSIGQASGGSRTSVKSNLRKSDQLTLFAADFLASHSVWPGSEEARQMTATSGRKCSALSRAPGRLGCLVKTLLESPAWASMTCFLTWKERVTPARRLLYQLAPSMPRTDGTGFGLWPTPTVNGNHNRKGASPNSGDGLATAVKMFPTPASRDYRSPNSKPYSERGGGKKGEQLPNFVGGQLNPEWVEWLMGYPVGWTDLEHSGTASSQPSLNGSEGQ